MQSLHFLEKIYNLAPPHACRDLDRRISPGAIDVSWTRSHTVRKARLLRASRVGGERVSSVVEEELHKIDSFARGALGKPFGLQEAVQRVPTVCIGNSKGGTGTNQQLHH